MLFTESESFPLMDTEDLLHDGLQSYINQILSRYDLNRNKIIEHSELRMILSDSIGCLETQITSDQLLWHFNRIDEEKKGFITFVDYFNHFFGNRARMSLKNLGKEENDEDELIDIDEFKVLMEDTFRPLNLEVTQEMVRWNFERIDEDGNGRISFEEYLHFIRKYNDQTE